MKLAEIRERLTGGVTLSDEQLYWLAGVVEAAEKGFKRMVRHDCGGKPQNDWDGCKICWFREYCALRGEDNG